MMAQSGDLDSADVDSDCEGIQVSCQVCQVDPLLVELTKQSGSFASGNLHDGEIEKSRLEIWNDLKDVPSNSSDCSLAKYVYLML